MEKYSEYIVLMVKSAFSKVNATLLDFWIKVTLFVKDKTHLKINIKVFEN
jgi:hypothetical protein